MQELTKSTEKALKIMYCEYRKIVKAGFSLSDASAFNGQDVYNFPAFSDWLRADIEFAIEELKSAEFVSSNVLGDIALTTDGIKYMQGKPREFFEELSGLFDLLSIIPHP